MKFLFIFLVIPIFCLAQNDFQKAENYYKQENFRKAKPIFQEYLKAHPSSNRTKEYLGDIASYSKNWDEALEYFGELVKNDGKSANYHFKYGGAMGMKALEISRIRALTYISDIKYHFERAADLDPKHIEVRWALIEFYIQLPGIIGGSERKALQYANELSKISTVDGYLAKGYVAEFSGRSKDAEIYYKKAIDYGGSLTSFEKLSSLYEKNNQPKEAMDTISRSFKVHKRNQLNYQIGKISAQYSLDPELGINSLETYIKNYSVKDGVPKDWAYFRLAQIYKNMGQRAEALRWITKALESRPDFKEAREEKSKILSL